MKKRMSRILSILLAFALIVSAGDVVQAEDVDGQTAEVQEMTEAEGTEEGTPQEDEPEITVTPVEETTETTETEEPVVEDKEEADVQESDEAENTVKEEPQVEEELETDETAEGSSDMSGMMKLQENLYGTVNAVTFGTKGTLVITANYTVAELGFGVFTSNDLSAPVTSSVYDRPGSVNAATRTARKCFSIPCAGTYYIGVYSADSSIEGKVPDVRWAFYDGSDRTLTNGQSIAVGQRDAQTNYFKFTAVSDGYIRIQDPNGVANSYGVVLCDKNKKALSGSSYLGNAPTYGVKKKAVYYIRVTSIFNDQGVYTLQATNSKISGKFGKTKKKASTIKKKKKRYGYIEAGSAGKKAKWYKFKLTKKKKVNITVEVGTNETLRITVYKGKRKVGNGVLKASGNITVPLKSSGKWTKGTYYIKVQREKSTSSGYYTLTWK